MHSSCARIGPPSHADSLAPCSPPGAPPPPPAPSAAGAQHEQQCQPSPDVTQRGWQHGRGRPPQQPRVQLARGRQAPRQLCSESALLGERAWSVGRRGGAPASPAAARCASLPCAAPLRWLLGRRGGLFFIARGCKDGAHGLGCTPIATWALRRTHPLPAFTKPSNEGAGNNSSKPTGSGNPPPLLPRQLKAPRQTIRAEALSWGNKRGRRAATQWQPSRGHSSGACRQTAHNDTM